MLDIDPFLAECTRKAKEMQQNDAILMGIDRDSRESVARYVTAAEEIHKMGHQSRLFFLGQCLSNPIVAERAASSLSGKVLEIQDIASVILWHTLCFREQIDPFGSK